LRRAARVIAPSGYLADALHGFQHDIEILPNAISLESYPFRWRTSARTRLVWLRAFHGRISKNAVAATIDSGDIFLNTSKIDNHLVTLLQARACWACVVTTQSGGVPYIVQDEVNCLSAEAGDATGFARAISELLTRRNWPHAFHAKPARASKLAIGRPSSRAGASCSAARQKHPATQRRGYTYEVTDCHSGV